ncbi:hypothetical protein KUCAC02_015467 [Chaenocephalus aceratus]|uniref:Uncharacterized protein n=1 Tax=Chaenocephalus aceratus TaxID=36190 RepID=A0ACB9XXK3_CHAAC|nr:hypothetical protein KUCAC02_015467 [Chaenocephalus aceratus]
MWCLHWSWFARLNFFFFLFLSLPSVYKHGKNKMVEKRG